MEQVLRLKRIMNKGALILMLMTFWIKSTVYALCTDNKIGYSMAGFCLEIDHGLLISAEELSLFKEKLDFLRKKFPLLISQIQNHGYRQIHVKPASNGETGGIVLAQTITEQKMIVIYEGFFSVLHNNPALQHIGYSVADIALLHELLHAFDEDNLLISHNYKLMGWDTPENLTGDAFVLPQFSQLSNSWITNSEVSKIKGELTPLLASLGPWEVYLLAREKVKKLGYPTIYSVVGGPLESFAELGAYIALDPLASSYIQPKTVKWFQENVLK